MNSILQLVADSLYLVFGRNVFEKLNKFLLIVSLRNLGYGYEFSGQGNKFRSSGEQKFARYLIKNDIRVVFDIGANSGEYSKLFLSEPSIKVYAFEPVPSAFKKLQELSTFFPNLHPIQVALGAQEEKATMYVSEKNTELSTLSKEVSEFGQAKKLEPNAFQVEIVTLDLYLNEFEEEIDFLKIDVEGFEMEVISGARQTLAKNPPKYIQIENSRHNLLRGNTIFDFSKKLPNYDLYQISNSSKSGLRKVYATDFDANIFLYSNFVFVRKLS